MKTDTAEKFLDALNVEGANIETYKAQLGLSNTDVQDNQRDQANLSTALDNQDVVQAGSKSITKVKDDVYRGDATKTLEPYPPLTLTALPFPEINAGALSRYNNRKARAKLAAGYTVQIGLAMGYEDIQPDPVNPDSLSASLKSYKDIGSYSFEGTFSKQGQSAMLFQYRIKGTEKWFDIKTALKSPVTISVTPPDNSGAALEIEIRVRLMDNNAPVGNWSPIYSLILSA